MAAFLIALAALAQNDGSPNVQKSADIASLLRPSLPSKKGKALAIPDPPPLPVHKFEIGAIGQLRASPAGTRSGDEWIWTQARVQQILDANTAVVDMGHGDQNNRTFVLTLDTTKLADGSTLDTRGKWYEVIGTRKFGTRTLFEVKPFDVDEFMKSLRSDSPKR